MIMNRKQKIQCILKLHLIFPEKLPPVFRRIFHYGKEARAGHGQILLSWLLNCTQLSTTGSGESVQVSKSKTTPEKNIGEKHWRKALGKSTGEKHWRKALEKSSGKAEKKQYNSHFHYSREAA